MAGKKGRSGRQVRRIEDQIELVEGYSLAHCIEIYNGDDEKKKFTLTKELTGKILARRAKVTGSGENGEIEFTINVKTGDDHNASPMPGNRISRYVQVQGLSDG